MTLISAFIFFNSLLCRRDRQTDTERWGAEGGGEIERERRGSERKTG